MARITLSWANHFRDLINSKMSDKKLISEYLKYAIKQENHINMVWDEKTNQNK